MKVIYHNDESGELNFEQLLIAASVAANMTMIEGLKQHALPLKTVGDALYIRNKIVERLDQATIHPDPERRKMLMIHYIGWRDLKVGNWIARAQPRE